MSDPNIRAINLALDKANQYRAAVASGMISVCPRSQHPSIVYRWSIEHTIAPIHVKGIWIDGIWINAWVYILFGMKELMDAFSNAWTTIQQNKLEIVELKALYDEALSSPERQLVLLTEFRLGCAGESTSDPRFLELQGATEAALKATQIILDKMEASDA
jgi:hypothetical protein